jgi:4-hydroxybenzoate polyprenyltransferase
MNDMRVPLCIELDRTLTPVDTLSESILSLIRHAPLQSLALPIWLIRGKGRLKRELASRTQIDAGSLPYRSEVLDLIKTAKSNGKRIILSTAAHRRVAETVAAHLGLFDEVLATDDAGNLSGEVKRATLVSRFGDKGFDLVGSQSDVAVWRSAREAVFVGSESGAERARRDTQVSAVLPPTGRLTAAWIRAMRLHQWVKNALVFLPALLAHQLLRPQTLITSLLAFLAFGLCASSVYFVNDLFDLAADRRHPRKRTRPFAAGVLPAGSGFFGALLLLASAAAIASQLNWRFVAVLAGYYVLTWAYSLRLKRVALLDVMTLAGLYTIRIVAGAAATGTELSFWLLAFSVFMFLSLGIIKRYTELDDLRMAGGDRAHGRGYSGNDLPLLMALGIASGYSAVVVIALYINSPESKTLYQHSKPLWLICPLMLYWISRMWLLTTRGSMHDDPVVFALRDRISLLVLGALAAIILLSI